MEISREMKINNFYDKFAKKGRTPGQWISYLKSKGAPKKLLDQIKAIEESGKKYNKSKEYIMRTIIDKIPKKYLDEPTKVHGPGKSGPLSQKRKSSEESGMQERIVMKLAESFINGNISYVKRETEGNTELKHQVYDFLMENGMEQEADFFRRNVYANEMKLSDDDYFNIERTLRKIAKENNIENIEEAFIYLDKEKGTINFKIKDEQV